MFKFKKKKKFFFSFVFLLFNLATTINLKYLHNKIQIETHNTIAKANQQHTRREQEREREEIKREIYKCE